MTPTLLPARTFNRYAYKPHTNASWTAIDPTLYECRECRAPAETLYSYGKNHEYDTLCRDCVGQFKNANRHTFRI